MVSFINNYRDIWLVGLYKWFFLERAKDKNKYVKEKVNNMFVQLDICMPVLTDFIRGLRIFTSMLIGLSSFVMHMLE